ncbi:MAG: FtsX-like permease family protein, partial [Chloroflexi bacterium]|nr:FtsX-like permease family protein [Chloroflexota bacterium]
VAREQAIAVMRSLGSRRTNVFRVILFETLVISLLGAAVGRIFGYGAASVIANIFTDESAIPIPIRVQADWELLLWALPLAVGALAGIIPAIMAYRVDVVEKLFPT